MSFMESEREGVCGLPNLDSTQIRLMAIVLPELFYKNSEQKDAKKMRQE